jgi:hypothetical protein
MDRKKKANELLSLPCLGYWDNTPNGCDFDCGYYAEIDCEDCVINFLKTNRYPYDPRTSKPITGKVLKCMKAMVRDASKEAKLRELREDAIILSEASGEDIYPFGPIDQLVVVPRPSTGL